MLAWRLSTVAILAVAKLLAVLDQQRLEPRPGLAEMLPQGDPAPVRGEQLLPLAGHHAQTRRTLPSPAQEQPIGTYHARPGDREVERS
jgi:hypothetical protein